MVASQICASAQIPSAVVEGLESGALQRLGGVIRDTDTREIVALLREAGELVEPAVSQLLSLSAAPLNANALNLALSTMEFAVVMKRLETIQKQLRDLQELLDAIDYKIDLSFYANFRAALDLAANALTMSNPETRRVSSMQAISRFLEAEHHYTQLVDVEIANRSRVAGDYLQTLSLAYVTEARCYLELEEIDTAARRLQEGLSVLRPRVQSHVRTLLTANPAAYLHSSLKGRIDLRQLTRVLRWLTPDLDENAVFEMQRENLFALARNPREWIDNLPQAIRLPVRSAFPGARLVGQMTRQLGRSSLAKRLSGMLDSNKQAGAAAQEPSDEDIFATLPETLRLIDVLIEQCSRFESYLEEVRTLRRFGVSFEHWRRLMPNDNAAANSAGLFCIDIASSTLQ